MSEQSVGSSDGAGAGSSDAGSNQPDTQSLAALRVAFARAKELRDRPFHTFVLLPKNGSRPKIARLITATNDREVRAGKTYVKCLIPYTEAEQLRARPKFFSTSPEGTKPHARTGMHLPVYAHEQWINDSRLENYV